MAKLIGINGIRGSGKDFLGKRLVKYLERHGFTCEVRKFADPIKHSLEDIFGPMTEEQYDEFKRTTHPMMFLDEARPIKGRDIVRGHGMKMRSYDGGQQFLDYVTAPSECDFVIVTDLRFENEFTLDWFYKFKVFNPSIKSDGHESETDWPADMFDAVVENDKGIDGVCNINEAIHEFAWPQYLEKTNVGTVGEV